MVSMQAGIVRQCFGLLCMVSKQAGGIRPSSCGFEAGWKDSAVFWRMVRDFEAGRRGLAVFRTDVHAFDSGRRVSVRCCMMVRGLEAVRKDLAMFEMAAYVVRQHSCVECDVRVLDNAGFKTRLKNATVSRSLKKNPFDPFWPFLALFGPC